MHRILLRALAGILAATAMPAQNPTPGSPLTELRGEVARVQITPGEGMPFLEIRSGSQVQRVYLGSMRYLMMQGFNVKVGERVVAKVYKMSRGFVAATVTLPERNKTLRLRDDRGLPVWRCHSGCRESL